MYFVFGCYPQRHYLRFYFSCNFTEPQISKSFNKRISPTNVVTTINCSSSRLVIIHALFIVYARYNKWSQCLYWKQIFHREFLMKITRINDMIERVFSAANSWRLPDPNGIKTNSCKNQIVIKDTPRTRIPHGWKRCHHRSQIHNRNVEIKSFHQPIEPRPL